jgi:hypothetical protein
MTSALTPVVPESTSHNQMPAEGITEGAAFQKQDTREYLAGMLRELSTIAAWAQLHRAQEYIDAALHEVGAKGDHELRTHLKGRPRQLERKA